MNFTTKTFVFDIAVAVLVSCIVSVSVTMILVPDIQGPKGDTGLQGTTGPQGVAGPTGPKGDTGATGPSGATGATGPTGLQGIQGIQGIPGHNGTQWFTGTSSPSNSAGVQGDFYLDLVAGDVYIRNSTSWNVVGKIIVPSLPSYERLEFPTASISGNSVNYLGIACYQISIQIRNTGLTNITINNILLNGQLFNASVPTSQAPGGILSYQTNIISAMLQPDQSLIGSIYLPVGSLWSRGSSVQLEIDTTTGRHYSYVVILP